LFGSTDERRRFPHIAVFLSLLLLLNFSPFFSLAEDAGAKRGELVVTCFEMPDVGRGAGLAVVLQTPDGHTYLYDTGVGYPAATNASGWQAGFNAGRDVIAPFLQKNNIKVIDGIVISHAHLDHYGGLLWLVDHFSIRRLYDSGYTFPGKLPADWQSELGGYDQLRDRFRQRGAYQEVHAGEKLNFDPALEVEAVAPPKTFFSEPHPEEIPAADPPAHYLVNANSLELLIRFHKVVFYLPGDLEKRDQIEHLLPSVPAGKLRADILIAPGHGLACCQTAEFADAVRPKLVIASVFTRWADHTSARELYGKFGAKVYLTGLQGTVTVTSDGVGYKVSSERSLVPPK
jgi:competence protein ComEC